jgi:hypothetical protein
MGKTTKLNPVRQTDGVKNHVTRSLSKHKIFNLTAMPFRGFRSKEKSERHYSIFITYLIHCFMI